MAYFEFICSDCLTVKNTAVRPLVISDRMCIICVQAVALL